MRLFIALASFVLCIVCIGLIPVMMPPLEPMRFGFVGLGSVPMLLVGAFAMAYNCATFAMDAINEG